VRTGLQGSQGHVANPRIRVGNQVNLTSAEALQIKGGLIHGRAKIKKWK